MADQDTRDFESIDLSGSVSGETGPEIVARHAKHLPNGPGVYRMLNADGDVLYVGKAKSLKKRVQSYTRMGAHTNRIARMVMLTAAMEFIRTRTETEALLLEANLIKRFRPRFNVLLRDDKSFPYILISEEHSAPQLMKHRGARKRKGKYFGPFASAGAVNRAINTLQKAFLIRTCSDSVYEARTRPCLLYQIKRCAAPCTGEISIEDYRGLVEGARGFLSGRSKAVKEDLARQMTEAADAMEFETAAVYRDRLSALSHVQAQQGINPQTVDEADVFACVQDGGLTCIQVFFFRTGQNWGNRAYFPKADKGLDEKEILASFLAQFYEDKPVPGLVLVQTAFEEQELLAQALSEHAGRKVSVTVPQRGEKKSLVEAVHQNAREALTRKLVETSTQEKLLDGLASAFDLPDVPRRIEVYDNSHIMGTNAVGGMIVAGPEGFIKGQYRKFNIRSRDLTPGDDFGMMREVLTRRFSRLLKEAGPRDDQPEDTDAPPWPDLLLIDGGKGQLSATMSVLEDLGVSEDVAVVGVAKGADRDAGREEFHIPGRTPFRLPPRDPVLYYIQRLRDEAHRFAIGAHRAKRSKEITKSPLDEIEGIGPTRKKALLHHFGTAKGVGRASVGDLQKVPGISAATAQTIYDFFNESG